MVKKSRYSDQELEEFRQIINEKLEVAQRNYDALKASLMNADNNSTDDTSPTYKVMEEGATTLSKEETTRLAQRQMKFIQSLQAALVRIENKTYGICRETGKLIPKERLYAVPHATLTIEAKQKKR
ncbi:MAG: TraR/DksA family transcriptional regulator [Bacteroidaceae bacterium]|jgi:DnaK suppressor protein|nr:TraR/DksA C4-type zinc finger protein [Bacteroidaceae bacterium]HBA12665.1 molecular chaperone DnaK [Bacteroidales bacterium]HOD68192.1 TraR/DksA C4-type zinc finger protein [Bacteroidaceae bacterium]HQL26078.1 TraR/DksA C4-type zinc finger protein [Bacteroidaceae bacterium]